MRSDQTGGSNITMSVRTQLLRNSSLSFVLNLVTKISNVAVFILIARRAGSELAGIFSLATTYIAAFSALTWGLDELMVRQVARDRSTSARYLSSFLKLRLILSVGLYGILAAIARYGMRYPLYTSLTIMVMGLSMVFDSIGNVGQAVLNAHEQFATPLLAASVAAIVKLAGALVALWRGNDLVRIGWTWCAGSCMGTWIMLIAARKIAGKLFSNDRSEYHFWKQHLSLALPFLTIGFLLTLEYQTDVLILSYIRGEADVGWYMAAMTIVYALLLLPQAYRVAVYPLMVRYRQSAPDKLARLYKTSFVYLAAAALPMTVGLNLLAPRIVNLIYGPAFENAIIPLQIIAWSLIFNFLHVPNSRLMLATEQQRQLSVFLIGSLTINIVLNLILDRWWGVIGAAVARLCSTLAFFLPSCFSAMRSVRPHHTLSAVARSALAVGVMALVVWKIRHMPLGIVIGIGIVSYLLAFLSFGGLLSEERQWLIDQLHGLRL